jgi:hypothetical protein
VLGMKRSKMTCNLVLRIPSLGVDDNLEARSCSGAKGDHPLVISLYWLSAGLFQSLGYADTAKDDTKGAAACNFDAAAVGHSYVAMVGEGNAVLEEFLNQAHIT